ncbi:MAG: DUF503 domain-containing protein [Candidatus Magnetoovum sp. WYHC-5]|nr:DUF503 domain-containing protein [Candidatus Magnetoovum sp. WYHC-5]
MVIGLLMLDLHIPEAGSLKSKRYVLKSLKDRLKKKFNVAIAEEGSDLWQRVTLYAVTVSNDKQLLNSTLDNVKNMVEREPLLELLNYKMEIL